MGVMFGKSKYYELLDLMHIQSGMLYNMTDKKTRRKSVERLEHFFFKAVEAIEPDFFVEIGAKEASASKRTRKHSPSSNVIAYEANKYNYKKYKGDLKKAGVDYRFSAVSKNNKDIIFKIRTDAKGQPIVDGQSSILSLKSHEHGYEDVLTPSTTLKELFIKDSIDSCVMWVDVEGANGQVLSKSKAALKRTSMIFIEVEERSVWDGQILRRDVDKIMSRSNLIPVARDFQSRYLYNVLYVNRDVLKDNTLFRRRLSEFYSSTY